jgi:hypothetical protein
VPTAPLVAASPELVAEIDDLEPPSALTALRHAAERVRERPGLLGSRLAALCAHTDRLAEVASGTYWHSNGFAKIKLRQGRDYAVRLHIWPEGTGRGEVNPHGHRWEFGSWILTGDGIAESYYEPDDSDGTGAARYQRCDYFSAPAGPGRLQPGDDCSLRVREIVHRPAGEVYTCELDSLHTVAPVGNGLVATIVVQGPARVPSAPVYLRSDRDPEPDPQPIPPSELRALLLDVSAVIGADRLLSRASTARGTYGGTPAGRATLLRTLLPHTPPPTAAEDDPVEELRAAPRGCRTLAGLSRVAEELRDEPRRLYRALSALIGDRDRLTEIAELSYHHPNGFAKVVLHAAKEYGIRLHVWPTGRPPHAGETEPHGHRWDFASWIVAGKLRETTFVPDPAGERYYRHSYHGVQDHKVDLRLAGPASLRPDSEIVRPTGTVYTRSRSELHTAAPVGSGLVASLVLQRPHEPQPAEVYRSEPVQLDPLPPLSVAELRELLAAVVAAV